MKSLRGRLNRGLASILVIVFVSQVVFASMAISYVAEKQMNTRLEHDGDSLLASLTFDRHGRMELSRDHLALVYEQPFSGHYFLIQAEGQILRSSSLLDEDFDARPVPSERQLRYHTDGPQQQPLLVLARSFAKRGQMINITVAEDLTAIRKDIAFLRWAYLLFSAILFLAALLLQNIDIRSALRPLWIASDDLSMIARGQKMRIERDVPLEIHPLVDEINWLLDLVERRLKQSRTAIGNLAHALKTPLAVLLQTIKDPRLQDLSDVSEAIERQTTAIHRLVEHELKRARLAGQSPSGQCFNPRSDLTALTQLLETVYADKQLTVHVQATDGLIPYDREDIMEVLGNLADNACKWAVSRVWIEVEYREGLSITIEDDGQGCSLEGMEQLAQRGVRLDEAKAGHGLGLAIVQDICDAYGGRLAFARSEKLSGFAVRVWLPVSAGPPPFQPGSG